MLVSTDINISLTRNKCPNFFEFNIKTNVIVLSYIDILYVSILSSYIASQSVNISGHIEIYYMTRCY